MNKCKGEKLTNTNDIFFHFDGEYVTRAHYVENRCGTCHDSPRTQITLIKPLGGSMNVQQMLLSVNIAFCVIWLIDSDMHVCIFISLSILKIIVGVDHFPPRSCFETSINKLLLHSIDDFKFNFEIIYS